MEDQTEQTLTERIVISGPRPSYKGIVSKWRNSTLWLAAAFLFVTGWLIWTLKTNANLRAELAIRIIQPSGR